jgi:hypothetical protein
MRSHLLLAATDEALADLFAVAFTGLPDFMKASLSDKKTRHINNQRAINHQFAEKITYDMLAHGHLSKKFKLYCPEPSRNFTNANFNIYCLATLIAKTIYEACDKNTVLLGNYALPLIHRILPEIGENLEKNKSYNLEMLFELLASRSKKEHPVFHAQLCHELRARFSSLITKNRIKSCAKL